MKKQNPIKTILSFVLVLALALPVSLGVTAEKAWAKKIEPQIMIFSDFSSQEVYWYEGNHDVGAKLNPSQYTLTYYRANGETTVVDDEFDPWVTVTATTTQDIPVTIGGQPITIAAGKSGSSPRPAFKEYKDELDEGGVDKLEAKISKLALYPGIGKLIAYDHLNNTIPQSWTEGTYYRIEYETGQQTGTAKPIGNTFPTELGEYSVKVSVLANGSKNNPFPKADGSKNEASFTISNPGDIALAACEISVNPVDKAVAVKDWNNKTVSSEAYTLEYFARTSNTDPESKGSTFPAAPGVYFVKATAVSGQRYKGSITSDDFSVGKGNFAAITVDVEEKSVTVWGADGKEISPERYELGFIDENNRDITGSSISSQLTASSGRKRTFAYKPSFFPTAPGKYYAIAKGKVGTGDESSMIQSPKFTIPVKVRDYTATITEVTVGALTDGALAVGGTGTYAPIDVTFTATGDLTDSIYVRDLAGIVKAVHAGAEHHVGYVDTLNGPQTSETGLGHGQFYWDPSTKRGKIRYNINVYDTVDDQNVDENSGYADAQLNGIIDGNTLKFQIKSFLKDGQTPKSNIAVVQFQESDLPKTYTIDSTPATETVATPTITGQESFTGSTTATIEGPTGATIYYTIDGSTPTTSSTEYRSPFTITATTTVKTIAVKNGVSSEVATKTFTKRSSDPTPSDPTPSDPTPVDPIPVDPTPVDPDPEPTPDPTPEPTTPEVKPAEDPSEGKTAASDPVVTPNEDGSTTTTTEYTDGSTGTKTEKVNEDGSSSTVETVIDTDGNIASKEVEIASDGAKVETDFASDKDGDNTSSQTIKTDASGNVTETIVETKTTDATTGEVKLTSETVNAEGSVKEERVEQTNGDFVATSETKDADGNVLQSKESSQVTDPETGDKKETSKEVTPEGTTESEKTTKGDGTGDFTSSEKQTDAEGNVVLSKEESQETDTNGTVTIASKTVDESGTKEETHVTATDGSGSSTKTVENAEGKSTNEVIKGEGGVTTNIRQEDVPANGEAIATDYVVNGNEVTLSNVDTNASEVSFADTIEGADGEPYNVSKVGENAFEGNENLTVAAFGAGITSFAKKAFAKCKNFVSMILGGLGIRKNATSIAPSMKATSSIKLGKNCLKGTSKKLVITVTSKADKKAVKKQLKKAGNKKAKVKIIK